MLAAVAVVIVIWLALSHQTGSAQSKAQQTPPLMARGQLDAPAGTVVLGADPSGGAVLSELRVIEGQEVRKGDIVAVLSNYANAAFAVQQNKGNLQKQELQRVAMTSGHRVTRVTMQEVVVQSARDSFKLKGLELARSGLTPEMRQLDLSIAQKAVEREEMSLRVMKEGLASEIEQLDLTIKTTKAALENARSVRDLAVIRSTLNGVVIQIFTRPGERVSPAGIVKIVDMQQIRVFAEVDDIHLGRVSIGSKVDIVIRERPTIFTGKVSRIAAMVKRMQRQDPDGGNATDAKVVQVEIEFDDPSKVPLILGREVKVSFP